MYSMINLYDYPRPYPIHVKSACCPSEFNGIYFVLQSFEELIFLPSNDDAFKFDVFIDLYWIPKFQTKIIRIKS